MSGTSDLRTPTGEDVAVAGFIRRLPKAELHLHLDGSLRPATALELAREIAKEIEAQLDYPGQIKVTVIRENRSVEYAK